MRMKAGTCAVFVLPLVFGLAAQGPASSCGGGATTRANTSANVDAARAADPPAAREGGSKKVGQQGVGRSAEAGLWGGRGVRLEVGEGGEARVEFDCAHGTFGKLALDDEGGFAARGQFVKERGGPVRAGREEEGEPARYSGKVEGKTMTLRVVLDGSGEEVGSYTLTHGRGARLVKCL